MMRAGKTHHRGETRSAHPTARTARGISAPAQRPPLAAVIQRAMHELRSLTHADIVELQRAIGNAAVAQLLADSAPREAEPRQNRTGLPDGLKAGIEHLSGLAMDDVRVHYNSPKPAEVQAFAYTQGTEIHIAPGQEHHLPHEAWHVVQQQQGRVEPTRQIRGAAINDDAGLEREADVLGYRALHAAPAADTSDRRNATPPRVSNVLQLATITLRPNGTISGVSFGKDDRPSSNSIVQAQHRTAFVAFEDMIKANAIEQTLGGAAQSLAVVLKEIKSFINPKTTKTYLFDWINEADSDLTAAYLNAPFDPKEAKKILEKTMNFILKIRNQIQGTAVQGPNKGAQREREAHEGLWEIEKALATKSGFKEEWGDENAVANTARLYMWLLLDLDPPTGTDLDAVKDNVIMHLKQMKLSYPKTFAWLSTKEKWYLMPFLKKGRLEHDKMPMARLDDSEIDQLEKIVARDFY